MAKTHAEAPPVLVWFEGDLRLADNPALAQAAARGSAVIPVFIYPPHAAGEPWQPGAASRWWLAQSLAALQQGLKSRGIRLIIRRGPALPALRQLVKDTGATAVFWNERFVPALAARDADVKAALVKGGVSCTACPGELLLDPRTITNGQGAPYRVFTPYWRCCLKSLRDLPPPLPAPKVLQPPAAWPTSLKIHELPELTAEGWMAKLAGHGWRPGEAGATRALEVFLKVALATYAEGRNLPGQAGTSALSPHLHFGEVSVRRVWHAVKTTKLRGAQAQQSRTTYLAELGWREFAHYILFHHPETPSQPLNPRFRRFPWEDDPKKLRAWTRGVTGYPLIDAGMRQLWETGWMHNRVRMAVGSFLVKHLAVDWRAGAAWFWDTLVDADLANNTLGWQWVAGCGADAAPYFRIFNPVLQGERFDPDGEYICRWLPQLQKLPKRWLHKPWLAPPAVLAKAGVVLGGNYPHPVIALGPARERALMLYDTVNKTVK